MKKNKLSGGLWPVMLTPFLENNQVDYEGLRTLTDFYIRTGAQGLFSNCLSSEMFQLTNEERLQVIRTVIETVQSKVPVVASGTFGSDLKKCSEFIKQVYDTGVDAVIVITNQLVEIEQSDDVFKRNIELLLKLTGDIPLGLYECPDPYKRLLSPDLMRWMGQTGRFLYHKDTSCDPIAIKNKLQAIKGTKLSLYNANTITALTSMEDGATGISPIGANLYPELYTFLVSEFELKGNTKMLVQLNAQLDMMDAIVDQGYPFSAKFFLQQRGLPITTTCRIPFGKMTSENYLKLQALQDVFMRTAEQFGVEIDSIKYA
jgi:4-hydroxy-tetrahydrodipicolinate synthase